MANTSLPIACTLSPPALHERRIELLHTLKAQVKEQRALPDGYALRFEGSDERLDDLVQVLRLERACCAFLTIQIKAEPNYGALWLELTGPAGTRSFIEETLGLAT